MREYRSLSVKFEDQVATITLLPLKEAFALTPPADPHVEVAGVLEELRTDDHVRVIVITGAVDGEFLVPPRVNNAPGIEARMPDQYGTRLVGLGVTRCFQAMTEIEKPIVAKVNGDAIGFGQSLVFGSDIIVAREDARISDVHLGMGEVETSDGTNVGLPVGVAPGDGAGALVPLFMTPTQAKEYMMLSPTYRASELAEARIVNRAVPLADLDRVTNEFVERLLRRSAFALAWTKRVLNRHVAQQLNLTMDASNAYMQLNLAQVKQSGYAPASLTRPAR